MTEEDVVIRVSELLETDIEPLKAFATLTKNEGMENVKRADFETLWETLKAQPFRRILARREAKEKRFKKAIVEAIMNTTPPEEEVMVYNQAVASMVQGPPKATLQCLDTFKSLLGEAKYEEFREGYRYLWGE